MLSKLPHLNDDGLITPEVGPWAEHKYRLVWNYAKMFTSSMKGKWDSRIYIDIYSGAGRSKIRDSNTIVPASPLLALEIPHPFDKYIYCEGNHEKIKALKERVKRDYPTANAHYIEGDITNQVKQVLDNIPGTGKLLAFCFIDPYRIKNFNFQIIRDLSTKFMDFMVLIPTYMDANRNEIQYSEESNISIEDFTGDNNWREKWNQVDPQIKKFGLFVADLFGKSMSQLGYIYDGPQSMVEIRFIGRNLPLYHLAFFSRHRLGMKFWKETQKYSTDQGELF